MKSIFFKALALLIALIIFSVSLIGLDLIIGSLLHAPLGQEQKFSLISYFNKIPVPSNNISTQEPRGRALQTVHSSDWYREFSLRYQTHLPHPTQRSTPPPGTRLFDQNFFRPSSLGFPIMNPNQATDAWLRNKEDQIVYHVRYHTNERGNRIVTQGSDTLQASIMGHSKDKDRLVAFLGCSFIFGQGLEDHETLPSLYKRLQPSTEVLNLGTPGSGPNDIYYRLSSAEGDLQMPDGPGVVLHYIIDHHFLRLLGPLSVTSSYWGKYPCLEQASDGIKVMENFETCRPIQRILGNFLKRSSIFQNLGFEWPQSYETTDLKFFAKVLGAIKAEIKSRNPNLDYLVIFAPQSLLGHYLTDYLQAEEIESLDLGNMPTFPWLENKGYIPNDGHPNASLNWTVAQLIRDYLKRKN